jgi:hypothetical protein
VHFPAPASLTVPALLAVPASLTVPTPLAAPALPAEAVLFMPVRVLYVYLNGK